ncbi:hypothetical protein ATANTOWER_032779 [Ataeniobius toweri]|uniref:4Fe-4S ferredoxin-type domain-containing protein n=1 Tax=Ataeniobius toweri TaxID=208326 RepID=A0ABU7CA22_9TELE|nr:hypothetical protein [Ataeniobius toweri]
MPATMHAFWLHSGADGSIVALQQCDSRLGVFLHVICMFSLCMRGLSPGTSASSHSPKNMTVRLIGLSKLHLGVNECVHGCLSCMSLCPCDGLATCPGCTAPLAHRLLEISTSLPVTHYGISGIEDE